MKARFWTSACILILLAISPAFADASRRDRARIAEAAFTADRLTVEPRIAFERAVLEILKPDGTKVRKSFVGEQPYFSFLDDDEDLADGQYRYLLRLFVANRRGAVTQTGAFVVSGGLAQASAHRPEGREISTPGGGGIPAASLLSSTVGASPTPSATSIDDVITVYDTDLDGSTSLSLESNYAGTHYGYQSLLNSYGWGYFEYSDATATYVATSLIATNYGEVGIGTFPTDGNYFEVYGDARFTGDVEMGSSRDLKTDIKPVQAEEVLAKLAELPVMTWKFKKGATDAVHIGPVAEDFHATFGLGKDDKHISAVDVSGVALAAIQGLNSEVENLQVQNRRLRALVFLAFIASTLGVALASWTFRRG